MKRNTSYKPGRAKIVFLFDVDHTLLDNDRVIADLGKYLKSEVGPERARRYWTISEHLRFRLGYAGYLGALQRYRKEYPHDLGLLAVSRFLIDYPFADRLFPNSIDWGCTDPGGMPSRGPDHRAHRRLVKLRSAGLCTAGHSCCLRKCLTSRYEFH